MANGAPGAGDGSGGDSVLSDWTTTPANDEPSAPRQGSFAPGTMIAGRYRVVSLLEQGGMGDIYRADDVKLGQTVALKFIRGEISPQMLARLYQEVRIGRQISHPNVCRLYDIVEVGGQTFLAMEYVDGENLSSLLARIGRLLPDKAFDIARDLSAALAAIHESGIVHRDLKPANIMIDGRGRARITDFGLAVALETSDTQAFAGTPAYMAPEQLSGDEVTDRSDIFAFGLIIFEMFTGRRFYDAKTLDELHAQHRKSTAARVTAFSRFLDPAAERAVKLCLAREPAARPASAKAVGAALPARDPLEAAIAAGETPSPELVAEAGAADEAWPGVAWVSLIVAATGLLLQAHLFEGSTLFDGASLPKPTVVLAERARDVLERLGYGEAVRDRAYSFEKDVARLRQIAEEDDSPDRWTSLVTAQPGPFRFFYRVSPEELVAGNRDGVVTRGDPPVNVPGMAEVVLDARGPLMRFVAVPPLVEPSESPWPEPDWSLLFDEAELDSSALLASEAEWAAPVDSDRKAAWEGTYPGAPGVPVRVEAAAYHGKPVWFEVVTPWGRPIRSPGSGGSSSGVPLGETGIWLIALAMPIGGALLARRNLLLGRGDQKAAFRVAVFVFATYGLARLLRADHVVDFGHELWILITVFAYPSFWAGQLWLLYLALEPHVRRHWPRILISWRRLLSGRFTDPLVGRDLVLGCAAGAILGVVFRIATLAPTWIGMPASTPDPFLHADILAGARQVAFRLVVNLYGATLYALTFLFILILLKLLLRKQWLAITVWTLVIAAPMGGDGLTIEWIVGGIRALIVLLVLTRGGLLPLAVAFFFTFVTQEIPLTINSWEWYSSAAVPAVLVLAALAAFGFHAALAGRPLFGRPLLDD